MRERQAGRSSNAVCGLAAVFRANQNENTKPVVEISADIKLKLTSLPSYSFFKEFDEISTIIIV